MSLSENIANVRKRIKEAAKRAGSEADSIKLLAVTKTHPVITISQALKAGIEYIAENKVQEAEEKIPFLKGRYKEFHFVGHLQSNKIKRLMKLEPKLIHSIDTYSTAEKLNKYLNKLNQTQNILIQVNTSYEESKFGVEPDKALALIEKISRLKQIKIRGLMTIGKFSPVEAEVRKSFRKLSEIFQKAKNIEKVEMKYLSMGMTNDFEIAIEEGANLVRIGTAIFGQREYK